MEERRQTGVYVSCTYREQSLKDLAEWLKAHNDLIPMPVEMDKVHTTIVYSRKDFPCCLGEEISLPSPVPFCPSGFSLLGKPEDEFSHLVMLLDAEHLVYVHEFLIEQGAEHDYDEYIPHVTIAYNVAKDFDYSQIKLPNFCLTPDRVKFAPLDLNWCLQEDEIVI